MHQRVPGKTCEDLRPGTIEARHLERVDRELCLDVELLSDLSPVRAIIFDRGPQLQKLETQGDIPLYARIRISQAGGLGSRILSALGGFGSLLGPRSRSNSALSQQHHHGQRSRCDHDRFAHLKVRRLGGFRQNTQTRICPSFSPMMKRCWPCCEMARRLQRQPTRTPTRIRSPREFRDTSGAPSQWRAWVRRLT